MADNKIVSQDFYNEEFKKIFDNSGEARISYSYFLNNYKSIMVRYIANGNPSEDTKRSYYSAIDNYLNWCSKVNMDPKNINEQHLLYYRSMLINQDFKPSSVKFKLTAIRRFYYVLMKYKLIEYNPAVDIHAQRDPDASLPMIKYLTDEQLAALINSLSDSSEEELRTKVIISLMAIEGLRTIEVYRMDEQDINFPLGIIYIKGKGHNDYIYPTKTTLNLLKKYIDIRYRIDGTFDFPVFTSLSNNSLGKRLSRRRIRSHVDEALEKLGLKEPGKSCHMLRHTCGTLLYKETKDLQVVKEVLRHKSVEMSSKYAHVQDAMLKRYTEAIPIKIKESNEEV